LGSSSKKSGLGVQARGKEAGEEGGQGLKMKVKFGELLSFQKTMSVPVSLFRTGWVFDPLDPTKGEVERKRSGRGELELRERELLFGGASSFGMQEGGDEAKSVVLISASEGGGEGDQKAE